MIQTTTNKFRLAVLISHPIQYQAPFFKEITKEPTIDLTVFYFSDFGLKSYHDKGFGKEIKWDIPLLDGYKYIFLKNLSPFPNPSTFFGLINPEVINYLKKEKYDAIWVHGWNSFTNLLVCLIAPVFGVSILLRSETNLLTHGSVIKNFLKRITLNFLFKRISAFLAIGKYNADFYKSYGIKGEKIFCVPYAVNNDFFTQKAKELLPMKYALRKKYSIPENVPVILFSGKLIPQKRPMDLLKAFHELKKEHFSASLVFVGDGSLKNKLENYVKNINLEQVFFMGFKNQTELPEFYAMSDVFVLPSEQEPWGLVVNEAMCFGLPVVVSDKVGAGGDLVKEGDNGYIFQFGDYLALKEMLRLVLSDDNKRKKMGMKSKEIIRKWSYNEDIEGLLSCLNNLKR